MATTNPIAEPSSLSPPPSRALLVALSAMPPEQLETLLSQIAASLPIENILIASPDPMPASASPALQIVTSGSINPSWILTATDFANAYELALKHGCKAVVLLGSGSSSIRSSGLRDLAETVLSSQCDLAVPCYEIPPQAGLVNSSILYPLTRGLFATRVRFPLPVDLGLSFRMAERLALAARRLIAQNQPDAPLWAVSEATVAGMTVEEVDVGQRELPQPAALDLNAILPLVTGSLFADIEAKAAFWQRARVTPSARKPIPLVSPSPADATAEVASLLQKFQLAYSNLREIWGLVLPPNSMLGLKRLAHCDAGAFRMSEQLWARIVFDFLVAYRLRSINRGHLLGALIPLYLAWVAGHLNSIASGANAERHIEALASAFEADKAYLVARWRWPDRFNP